ncbi:MAG: band-7 C-terminal domain-containing protein, partial [Anaerohalosphaeraceae bacterium]
VAIATALGVREIAKAINEEGGRDAVNLRVAEQYIEEFGNLAKETNSMIIPTNLADIAGVIKAATSVIEQGKKSA